MGFAFALCARVIRFCVLFCVKNNNLSMKKIYLLPIFLCCMLMPSTLFAQSVMTVRGMVSAGGTQNNVYAAIGQPFYKQIKTGNYELSYGVAQAQLVTRDTVAETCLNEPFHNDLCFDIPADELVLGVTDYEKYENNVDELLGYDLLCKLKLTVWPIFATAETKMFHGELPVIDGSLLKNGVNVQLVEGENVLNYLTVHGCDSVVTLTALLCPWLMTDADANDYNTLVMDNYCWTQTNLKTTHYDDGAHQAVAKALVYNSSMHPDMAENELVYGRLYTWYSAVGLPEGSGSAPVVNSAGFVRGICPEGWHIPAAPEAAAFNSHDAYSLRSSNLWASGAGNNSTDFTLLPAGRYFSMLNRFEQLLSDTRLWFVTEGTDGHPAPATLSVTYFCDSPVSVSPLAADAYSVRCVKDY